MDRRIGDIHMKKISVLPNSNADGSGGFTYGSVKDVTGPGLFDGTPFRADWQNDIQSFHQRLLTESAVVPNGSSDTPATSQLYDALESILNALVSGIYSGEWTPTLTSLSGITTITAYQSRFLRIGSIVYVSVLIAIIPSGSGDPSFRISLPIASSISMT